MSVQIPETLSFDEVFKERKGFILSEGEIHVWNVSLDCDNVLTEKYKKALSEQELQRISFFKFENIQNNYLVSQGALRLLLSVYLNATPDKIIIGRHSKGKPFPIEFPQLRFNMSNSGRKVIFAFSPFRP